MNLKKSVFATLLTVVVVLLSACGKEPDQKPEVRPGAEVKVEFSNITQFELTATFTPNDSVQNYRFIIMEKGEMGNQLNQFHFPDTITYMQMVATSPDKDPTQPYKFTFKDLTPATEWEVYVMPINWKDEIAPIKSFGVTTAILGGSGDATVTINIGEFALVPDSNNPDSLVGAQLITVTPNDQAALYRFVSIDSSAFYCDTLLWKGSVQNVLDYLKSENNPFFPEGQKDPFWNLYKEDKWVWALEPSSTYFTFAIARNADGKYGELVRKNFTTPDSASVAQPKAICEPLKLRR